MVACTLNHALQATESSQYDCLIKPAACFIKRGGGEGEEGVHRVHVPPGYGPGVGYTL